MPGTTRIFELPNIAASSLDSTHLTVSEDNAGVTTSSLTLASLIQYFFNYATTGDDTNPFSGFQIALGDSATISSSGGNTCIVIGRNSSSTGQWGSTALGSYNTASGYYNTACGYDNNATGEYGSTAFGVFNQSTGIRSTVCGYDNTASNTESTAIGYDNTASNYHTAALGFSNQATGPSCSALGIENQATGESSTACGYSNTTSSGYGCTFGAYNQATGENFNTAIGYRNLANGQYSSAFGSRLTAEGYATTACGYSSTASNTYASVFGSYNTASGRASTACGYNNNASGQSSSAIGWENSAQDAYASAFGGHCTASANYASAFGYLNIASGQNSIASGYQNTSSGSGSSTSGYKNTSSGFRSAALGSINTVSEDYATAAGYYNDVTGQLSTAIGTGNVASGYASQAIGTRNFTANTETIAIGNINVSVGGNSPAIGMGNFTGPLYYEISNVTVDHFQKEGLWAHYIYVDDPDSIAYNIRQRLYYLNQPVYITINNGYNKGTYCVFDADHEGELSYFVIGAALSSTAVYSDAVTVNIGSQIFWYADTGDVHSTTTGTDGVILMVGESDGPQSYLNLSIPVYLKTANDNEHAYQVTSTSYDGTYTTFNFIDGTNVYNGGGQVYFGVQAYFENNSSGEILVAEVAETDTHTFAVSFDQYQAFEFSQFLLATGGSNDGLYTITNVVENGGGATITVQEDLPTPGTADGVVNGVRYIPAVNVMSSALGYVNQATGFNSTAVGGFNTASNNYGIAIGQYNTASGFYSVAFGYANTASAYYSTAIGIYNNSSYEYSVSVGQYNSATDEGATAFGFENAASGYRSSAFGYDNTVSGSQASAFGYDNTASGPSSSAFGWENSAYGESCVAAGYQNVTYSNYSSTFGAYNTVNGEGSQSLAVGYRNTVNQENSNAVGSTNQANYNNCQAFGYNNTAGGNYCAMFGINNQADGAYYGTGFGTNNTVSGVYYPIAFGFENTASAYDNPTAVGAGNIASGDFSNAFGYENTASGSDSSAFGYENNATNTSTSAFGRGNTASNYADSAFGYGNTAEGGSSTASGYENTASGEYATASGAYNIAIGEKSTASGYRNQAEDLEANAFGSHNVASNYRSNAFGRGNNATNNYANAFGISNAASGYGSFVAGIDCTGSGYSSIAIGLFNNSTHDQSAAIGFRNTVSAQYATALGCLAVARIEKTTNIGGPIIIRKDNDEDSINEFQSFAGNENIITSKVVDLTTESTTTITLPTGCSFFPNECGLIITKGVNVTAQPIISFGDENNSHALVSAVSTTGLTSFNNRQRFMSLNDSNGHTSLVAAVTSGGSADNFAGRFYWKGMLVEDTVEEVPFFYYSEGDYTSPLNVRIDVDYLPDSTIYYTTDGSPPTTGSTVYEGSFDIYTSQTITALAVSSRGQWSTTSSGYYYNLTNAMPQFSPSAGTYDNTQSVTISNTSGAYMIYTTDGTTPTYTAGSPPTPTGSSILYSGPVDVDTTGTTIKAISVLQGANDSSEADATYTLQVGMVSISPDSGTYDTAQSSSIGCDTSGATGYYGTGFGVNLFNNGNPSIINDIAIQSDNKVVFAGKWEGTYWQAAITRYNADGSLDTTFTQNLNLFSGNGDEINSVAIQSNSKIVIGGQYNSTDAFLGRLNSDGSFDTSFNSSGYSLNLFGGSNDIINAIAIQTNGKIVCGGRFNNANAVLAIYNTDGTADSSFGSGGHDIGVFGGSDDTINDVAIQTNGKIVVVGTYYDGQYHAAVARLNTDGTFDTGFNSTGYNRNLFSADNTYGQKIAIQGDGKIVVGGQNGTNAVMMRLNTDGSIDTTNSSVFTSCNGINILGIQSDGKIVAGTTGTSQAYAAITRFNTDMTTDTSFGDSSGYNNSALGLPTYSQLNAITIQSDDKIILGGMVYIENDFAVALRINSNGTPSIYGSSVPIPISEQFWSYAIESGFEPSVLSYKNYVINVLPTVTTDSLNVSSVDCHVYGTIVDQGGSDVIAYGFVYAANTDTPDLSNHVQLYGTEPYTGSFNNNVIVSDTVDGMFMNGSHPVWFAAYATNNSGTSYGSVLQTSPNPVICLMAGTPITLADGTKKNIEDVTYDDLLLVWNFDEGKLDSANPIWIMKSFTSPSYDLVKFSDGSELKTVSDGKGHSIFNIEKGAFTNVMSEDTPIGTTTHSNNGDEKIVVVSKETIKEEATFHNIITEGHINMFANGILTSTKLNNLYPVNNMKFVKEARVARSREEFGEISDALFNGLRLAEQPDSDGLHAKISRIVRSQI